MRTPMSVVQRALLTSLVAYAGIAVADDQPQMNAMMPPVFNMVTVAHPDSHFEVSFTGLALQSFANNLDYAAEALPFNYVDSQAAVSPNWVIPEISSDFHFGFDLELAGMFHGANSSLMLNWERYHSPNDSGSIAVTSINNMVGPWFEIGPDASTYKQATGKVHFDFDEVNADYGTFIHFGDLFCMNVFAGVSFGRLLQHNFVTISDLANTVIRTISVPAKFIGAGPQVGVNFMYKIVKGFQFVGNTRATLFVGTFKNSTTYSTTSHDLVVLGDQNPNVQTTTVYNRNGVVPGFEGKLGLAYEYCFCSHYMFKIEAGYQAQVYVNAIRSINMGSEVALGGIGSVGTATTGVYARSFERLVSDFGLAGPYATIDLAF